MSREIFRKEALERLTSPEQLDRLMPITSPRGWLSLAGLGLILLVALLWGFFGSIAITVEGHGVLVRPPGEKDGEDYQSSLTALVYVPIGEGYQIEPGMTAEVLPLAVNKNRTMRVAGQVQNVGKSADDPLSLQIIVNLLDAPPDLDDGAPCEAKVTIKKQSPIHLVLPWSSH